MNEDAFARRFYADRAELESLGHPADGRQAGRRRRRAGELLAAARELPPPGDRRSPTTSWRRCRPRSSLLDGEFAYAEPLRLALQQISWGRPSPLGAPEQTSRRARHHRLGRRPRALPAPGEDRDGDLPQQDDHVRLLHDGARRGRRAQGRPVPPALPGRPVLPPRPLARARRAARLPAVAASAARSPTRRRPSTTSSAPRTSTRARTPPAPTGSSATRRAPPRSGSPSGSPGRSSATSAASARSGREDGSEDVVFVTDYAVAADARSRGCCASASTRGSWAPEPRGRRARRARRAARAAARRAAGAGRPVAPQGAAPRRPSTAAAATARRETAIRPERFARLVTLASILIEAGRAGARSQSAERVRAPADLRRRSCARTSTSSTSSTSAAAPTCSTPRSTRHGEIEVDPEPYSDNFARPARLLPVEAKALVAAIDLIGEHLPAGSLTSAREKIVAALGADPMEQGLQVAARRRRRLGDRPRRLARRSPRRRLLRLEYYKANEDEFSERTVEPYALINGREGWYVASFDPAQGRRPPLPPGPHQARPRSSTRRFEPRPEVDPPPTSRAGRAPARSRPRASRASGSRPSAPAGRARSAASPQELADGSIVVELPFAGTDWLVREVLKEAGDAVVLEPEDAREAVREAVQRLRSEANAAH